MLKHHNEKIQLAVRAVDVMVALVAFVVAYRSRFGTFPLPVGGDGPIVDGLTWLLAASLALHLLVYPALGFYQSFRRTTSTDAGTMVFKAFLTEVLVLAPVVFFFEWEDNAHRFFAAYLLLNDSLILVEKLGARILLSTIRSRGYNFREVLIAGTGRVGRRVLASLTRRRHWGYVPSGFLKANDDATSDEPIDGIPVVGRLRDLQTLVLSRTVDEVYFAFDRFDYAEISDQVALCHRLGIPARITFDLLETANSEVAFSLLDSVPVVTLSASPMSPTEAIVKRFVDIVVSVVGLTLTMIVLPWISWRIRQESLGPVIFKQVRVGQNGRLFKCYKFRTMYVDAEARKPELMQQNLMQGPIFKLEPDPRVTPFGAFLRRTSLDELPQFLNVLRGEMSVVGTRPPTPDEVSRYQLHYRRRLSIRPGLTGLWQVSGRSRVSRFEEILALDLSYIDRWSIWLDLRIIGKTFWVALRGRGAL